jgi:uracil-DNA glycosylase family 4
MLTFGHSARQLEYARFKANLLFELEPHIDQRRVAAVAGGDPLYDVVHVRTSASRALRLLRADFYGPVKRVPEWIARRLNARMLAFWFMDDGYTRIRPGGRQPLAEIATVGFVDSDLQILIAGLRRLGLASKALRGRLYFDVPTTRRLCELIAPYLPPAMRYKLDPAVAGAVPFDPALFARGSMPVMFDAIEVEDVTHKRRLDTTFFCIDVEETHNFVTSGGVVHNCRPPDNRDPLPREIEACQHYLHSQVALIQPSVICTLGNFSTKLLRGDPAGISRVHGQPEVRTLGSRAVRLYPLFHPAAALYTPSMLQTLRDDFKRIPELLALGPPEQPPEVEFALDGDLPLDLEEALDEVPEALVEVPALAEPEPPGEQLGLF